MDTPNYIAQSKDLETLRLNFNIPVSCFRNVYSIEAVNIEMGKWLRSIIAPQSDVEKARMELVLEYRKTLNPYRKKRIPMFIPGALMNHRDKDKSDPPQLRIATGWMQFDVDAKDNPQMTNAAHLRDEIAKIVYVAFCSISTSGKGVWGLIKVKDGSQYREHFEQLKIDFASLGINLDPSKGGNPTDPRFYTYDPDAYIAPDFRVYDRIGGSIAQAEPVGPISKPFVTTDSWAKVNGAIATITQRNLDIAPDYETYRNIGFALANEFGEGGRDFFHAACQPSPKYNRTDADRQYSACIRAKGGGITIGTFFHLFARATS